MYRAVAEADDAAGIGAVFQAGGAVGGAVGDISDVGLSHDAADALIPGVDGRVIDRPGYHAAVGEAFSQHRVGAGQVQIRVQGVFQGHHPGDSADIGLSCDLSHVPAVCDFPQGNCVGGRAGRLVHDQVFILRGGKQIDRLQSASRECVQVVGDCLQILLQHTGAFPEAGGHGLDLSGHARDRIDNHRPEIRHGVRIRNAELPKRLFDRSQEAGQSFELTGDVAGQNVGIMDGVVDRLMQRVHPVAERSGQIGRLRDLDVRLRLADDAPHVLPAVDGSLVARAVDVSLAPSGDPADVVAKPGVAHRFSADAVFDEALVVSADAAGVGGDARRLGGQAVEEVQQAAGIDVIELQARVHAFGVDVAAAVAGDQRAVVHAAYPADLAEAGHIGRTPAARHNPSHFVASHQAAGLQFSGHRSAEGTVQDAAPVQPHQAAGHVVVPSGHDGPRYREVLHDGVHAGLEEETAGSQRIRQTQVEDAVSASVKAAVEQRDRLKIHIREGEVVVQHHRQVV